MSDVQAFAIHLIRQNRNPQIKAPLTFPDHHQALPAWSSNMCIFPCIRYTCNAIYTLPSSTPYSECSLRKQRHLQSLPCTGWRTSIESSPIPCPQCNYSGSPVPEYSRFVRFVGEYPKDLYENTWSLDHSVPAHCGLGCMQMPWLGKEATHEDMPVTAKTAWKYRPANAPLGREACVSNMRCFNTEFEPSVHGELRGCRIPGSVDTRSERRDLAWSSTSLVNATEEFGCRDEWQDAVVDEHERSLTSPCSVYTASEHGDEYNEWMNDDDLPPPYSTLPPPSPRLGPR
ncbi:hypothetical protein CC78DRAFT_585142 [Lojkania enalia]|uniref:Uncharacterized protein n=1 Tax=Lojkania enalia TaxID=147567 RepID=A0A9P4K3E6_9PLEO|nr:hypothetical protein CC78DRAFT_585142 [Didymosphaeria enalia]